MLDSKLAGVVICIFLYIYLFIYIIYILNSYRIDIKNIKTTVVLMFLMSILQLFKWKHITTTASLLLSTVKLSDFRIYIYIYIYIYIWESPLLHIWLIFKRQ